MVHYVGSGPYCYANSLVMVLGAAAPAPAVLETLTGSAFGVELVGGTVPYFDPYGWDPETGLDDAVALLGHRCERTAGGSPGDAVERLRAACAAGPVLVGPVDMSLLPYQPGWDGTAVGVDHYLVALAVDGGEVLVHDPHGHPYATLPVDALVAAWRAEAVGYVDEPFTMRSGFRRVAEVTADDALRRALPAAVRWLDGRDDLTPPPGTLGGAAALGRLAELATSGLPASMRTLLGVFSIRVGARRLADAAVCLDRIGCVAAASAADDQARLLGRLQHPVVTGDGERAATALRALGPGYVRLRDALAAAG